jgi:putative DNA primase/helicase
MVTAIEADEGRRLDEQRLKRMTGEDMLTARFLFKEHFEFRFTGKICLAVNARPEISGTDDGIWRRVRLVPCLRTFQPHEQDRKLKDKLLAERSGILRWLVDGCLEWQKRGLGGSAAIKRATVSYREESNPVALFVEETCTVAPELRCDAKALAVRYSEWAGETQNAKVTPQQFGRKLAALGYSASRTTTRPKRYLYLGLAPTGSAYAD